MYDCLDVWLFMRLSYCPICLDRVVSNLTTWGLVCMVWRLSMDRISHSFSSYLWFVVWICVNGGLMGPYWPCLVVTWLVILVVCCLATCDVAQFNYWVVIEFSQWFACDVVDGRRWCQLHSPLLWLIFMWVTWQRRACWFVACWGWATTEAYSQPWNHWP